MMNHTKNDDEPSAEEVMPTPTAEIASESTTDTTKTAKRSADRQLTKDDGDISDDDDDDDDDRATKVDFRAPFAKASSEILAGRKILKARRPEGSSGTVAVASVTGATTTVDPPATSTTTSTATSSNPFANTVLTASTSEKKIFGAGFGSGFAVAANPTGAGASTSTTGTTATSFGGFGAAAASSSNQSSNNFVFGKSMSSTTSLFAIPPSSSSMFSFGFSKTNIATPTVATDDNDSSSPIAMAAATSKATPTLVLPEHVELANGEEQELNLHEARCKTFKWVEADETTSATTSSSTTTTTATTASSNNSSNEEDNKPSSSTTTLVTSSIPSSKEFSQLGAALRNGGDVPTETAQGNLGDNDDPNNTTTTEASVATTATTTPPPATSFRWQELGVGPMKLLQDDEAHPPKFRLVQRRESTPNGSATKVLLNLPIYKESKASLKVGQENYLSFCTIGPLGKTETYLWKFKEVAEAKHFYHALQGISIHAKSCFVGAVALTPPAN
jgi:NUP50 (Nucleoporin 50 kDa)/RanBP1 domain